MFGGDVMDWLWVLVGVAAGILIVRYFYRR